MGRAEAMKAKVEHVIKDENGRIAERNFYGNDSRSNPGQQGDPEKSLGRCE